jgi:hypothetical protein
MALSLSEWGISVYVTTIVALIVEIKYLAINDLI